MLDIYRSSALRKHRQSTSGQLYTIRKRCEDVSRPIIDDPTDPLANSDRSDIIAHSLQWAHENGRAKCLAFVVMPDHYHWVFQLGVDYELASVVASVSTFTAWHINERMSWTGSFWQSGYHEHAHRNADTTERHVLYVIENPVRAGFVGQAQDWPFGEVLPDWSMDSWH